MNIPNLNEGETYVGRINDTHVILLPGDIDANWRKAGEWAASIGGELPNRVEQALMFATLRDQFQPDWYWSSETHASLSDSAWMQHFSYGNQFFNRRLSTCRARAVRRLPIQSFSNLAGD